MINIGERELTKTTKNAERLDIFGAKGEQIDMQINLEGQAHIMNLLTDLYQNPVEATIRETVSNAIDAVVENGSGEVYISSPSMMTPVFTVRDTGVGMSEEEIRNVYSMYGASTKTDDFDQIGAFGLGAKAPLSYCSEFTVRTIKDGKAIEMTISKQADGNKVELFELEDVNETSGTTVRIPVREEDINRFAEVLGQYQYLPEMPADIYLDEELVGYDEKFYMLISDNFQLAKDTYGKIWLKREYISDFLKGRHYGGWGWGEDQKVDYLLGGWNYKSGNKAFLLVEIKPGVLNFSSSRDEITKDERFYSMEKAIEEHTDQLRKDVVKRISEEKYKYTKELFHRFVNIDYRFVRDGESYSFVRSVSTDGNFELEDIRSSDGVALVDSIEGEENAYCSIMYDEGRYSSDVGWLDQVKQSQYLSITEINEAIEKIVDNKVGFNINEIFFRRTSRALVITEVSSENIDKFRLRRKAIVSKYPEYRIIFTWKTNDEIKKEINKVGMKELDDIEFITLDKLNEELLEEARNKRATQRDNYEDGIRGQLVTYDYLEEDTEVINDSKFFSTDEILEKGYYVLFVDRISEYQMVDEIRGFSNKLLIPEDKSVKDLDGKEILVADLMESKRLRAQTYNQLDPKQVGVNTDIPLSSKSARNLSETRRYNRSYESIVLSEETKKEIIALLSLKDAGVTSGDLYRIRNYSDFYSGSHPGFMNAENIPNLKARVEISEDLVDKIKSLVRASFIYYDMKNTPKDIVHFNEIKDNYMDAVNELNKETYEELLKIGLDMKKEDK